jgi:chemotaxis signal transduction protein
MSVLGIDVASLKSVFSLRVRGVRLVVPSHNVMGVVAFEPPTRIPRTPAHIIGLLPHGDGALAVVDLAEFLAIPHVGNEPDAPSTRRVVVTRHGDLEAGMVCDQTHGVMAFEGISLEPATVLKAGRLAEFVSWEFDASASRVGVLNLAALLDSARVKSTRSER